MIAELQLKGVVVPFVCEINWLVFQVHDCTVETMDGIEAAFHWLVQACHRK